MLAQRPSWALASWFSYRCGTNLQTAYLFQAVQFSMASQSKLLEQQRALKLLTSSSASVVQVHPQSLHHQQIVQLWPSEQQYGRGPIEAIEGADDIGIGITCAIRPWSRRTRVEVESEFLLVLGSRLLCKLKVALEEIVVTTASKR